MTAVLATLRGLHRAALYVLVAGCASAGSPRVPTTASVVAPRGDLGDLRAMIDSAVDAPVFRSAHWGILIVDPDRGDTLYSRNAGKLFMPASNQKILTGATALARLGPDFRFRTAFATRGTVKDSTLRGDLVVLGRGDPSLSDRMRGDAMQVLRDVADSLRAHGIRRITGRLTSEGNAFPDSPLGFGWSWDDLDYPYSAGVDELMFNEGFSRIIARGGRRAGDGVTVAIAPARGVPAAVQVTALTVARPPAPDTTRGSLAADTTAAPPEPEIQVRTDSGGRVVLVTGTIFPGDSVVETIAHRDPTGAYLSALREALTERGIVLEMRASTTPVDTGAPQDTIFTLFSPPLREILPVMEKPSQNQVAEALLKTLGLEFTGHGSADSGRRIVEAQLVEWGAATDGFVVRDGSGLSRHNYVTPETIVRVLAAMRRDSAYTVFYDALPIAGVDGTLSGRMRGTPAQGNVRAKTGYIDRARSLSGYVTTPDGRTLIFSLLCNNWTTSVRNVERVQDEIAARLASLRH